MEDSQVADFLKWCQAKAIYDVRHNIWVYKQRYFTAEKLLDAYKRDIAREKRMKQAKVKNEYIPDNTFGGWGTSI